MDNQVIQSKSPNYALFPSLSINSATLDSMNIYYPEAKEFFKNVDLKGSIWQKCKTVVDFLNQGLKDKEKNHICLSGPGVYGINSDQAAKFRKNGIEFEIMKLNKSKFLNLFDYLDADTFKTKAILAIDSAELRGGKIPQKQERFIQVFPGKVNIYVSKKSDNAGIYFIRPVLFHEETRLETLYMAWI